MQLRDAGRRRGTCADESAPPLDRPERAIRGGTRCEHDRERGAEVAPARVRLEPDGPAERPVAARVVEPELDLRSCDRRRPRVDGAPGSDVDPPAVRPIANGCD